MIVPSVRSSSPAINRRAVDLPQPDGPSSTRNSGRRSRDRDGRPRSRHRTASSPRRATRVPRAARLGRRGSGRGDLGTRHPPRVVTDRHPLRDPHPTHRLVAGALRVDDDHLGLTRGRVGHEGEHVAVVVRLGGTRPAARTPSRSRTDRRRSRGAPRTPVPVSYLTKPSNSSSDAAAIRGLYENCDAAPEPAVVHAWELGHHVVERTLAHRARHEVEPPLVQVRLEPQHVDVRHAGAARPRAAGRRSGTRRCTISVVRSPTR